MKRFITTLAILIGTVAYAHGEDKLGPHGGFIAMPGAFHTEVVREGKTHMRLYLLDLNWANPVVLNSAVDLEIRKAGRSVTAKCAAKAEFFLCSFPQATDVASGELIVKSSRNGQVGNKVSYRLPLMIEASKKQEIVD